MIYTNSHELKNIFKGNDSVLAIYKGVQLVWNKIKEIFGCQSNGYWIDQYPWIDNQSWTD